MLTLNERAWVLVAAMRADSEALGCEVHRLAGGATVIDAGVQAPGGVAAGLRMAEIACAGLAQARVQVDALGSQPWPAVEIYSDHAWRACWASQSANWKVDLPGSSKGASALRGMGSGPACLLAMPEHFAVLGLIEPPIKAVLTLEARALPDDAACDALADACGVPAGSLAVIVAPTSSLAGSAQIAARSVETALHKLERLGFDLRRVVSGGGRCPLAPPTGDDWTALGRTNDAMNSGSRVWLALSGAADAELAALVERIPASASPAYGQPFLEALKAAGDFYALDAGLFAPAEITLFNLESGRSFHAGGVDEARLLELLGGAR
jgi:methenyltetrahydromethanopterin cyclohydrolase